MKRVSLKEAVASVQSGEKVFIQGAAMTPATLVDALCERYKEVNNVEFISIHTDDNATYLQEPYNKSFYLSSCFVGSNVRKAVNGGNADYIPIFLSEIHQLFRNGRFDLDTALIQVSPPDKHGYCSLGVSVDITLPAVQTAKKVIALINDQVPRTHGDGIIHISQIDYAVEVSEPIHSAAQSSPTDIESKIGKNVAGLIEDGATLQMGIGNIPNAVLSNLHNHKNLGIHTEMFADGILPLVETGVINGSQKKVKPGKIVTTFAIGSQKLYNFIDDNPLVHFKEAAYTNDTSLIKRNPKVTAINSAIEVDLTGQICADTIGPYQFSGVGGQMDFMRGASLSKGGKPIIAMPSATRKGVSKIVSQLQPGAGVTTTRAHAHYIATEYGVVDLFGLSLKKRAKALIDIAHPDHREALDKEMFERFKK